MNAILTFKAFNAFNKVLKNVLYFAKVNFLFENSYCEKIKKPLKYVTDFGTKYNTYYILPQNLKVSVEWSLKYRVFTMEK